MITRAITVAAVLLALAGCDKPASETHYTTRNLYVFRDAQTGCEYVGASTNGITPRMGRDGKQLCGDARP